MELRGTMQARSNCSKPFSISTREEEMCVTDNLGNPGKCPMLPLMGMIEACKLKAVCRVTIAHSLLPTKATVVAS